MDNKIYEDIATRTGGDIYIGVVGPVRTGKSTFIKRFMETLVIPGIDNIYVRERARDELPQSGSGRTIMTAEPKFVPEEAVSVSLEDGATFNVRLIDCVGYMVEGASGSMEDGEPRMVSTPWFDHPVPMTEAAETGTRKVIAEHSTIGIVITTDGTVTDLDRADYMTAETRVIGELQELSKPFIVVVNSAYPDGPAATAAVESIRETYDVACIAVDCLALDHNGINGILRTVLSEFPVQEMGVFLPAWVEALDTSHPIKRELFGAMLDGAADMRRVRDVEMALAKMRECETISSIKLSAVNMGTGTATATVELPRPLFYRTLCEQSGFEVSDDGDLMSLLRNMSVVKSEYDKISAALNDVRETGYGIVMPSTDELTLEEPEIVKQGGRYGVRLRASAPSIHYDRIKQQLRVQKRSRTRWCVSA